MMRDPEPTSATLQARRRRFPLLPDGPLGWTPYAWLLYLVTFLIEPIIRTQQGRAGALYWAANIAGMLLFLAAYFRGYWVSGRRLIRIIAFITLLGAAFVPINIGAVVLFVYAGGFAGYLQPQRAGVRALLLVVLAAAVLGFAVDAPTWYWFTTVIILLIGGVNLHFAQSSRDQQRLRLAHDEIEHLAAVAERERIARDLHDVLGHTLSLIVLKAELASRIAERDPARAAGEMRDVEDVARRTLQEVRETLRGYRATLGDEAQRAGAMLKAADVKARFEFEHVALPRPLEEALALALREAVTNVARHADASTCAVRLSTGAGAVTMEIHDDGRGSHEPEGGGLRGMRERIEACGGRIEREDRNGMLLRITIPLDTPTDADASQPACAVSR
jgi:two-component system sensor histidine kinase DesK